MNVISRSAADLTYDTFSKEVDKLIGRDRSWTNMVLTFYVGKRVVTRAKEVKNYFEQYIRSYNPVLQQAGGLVSSSLTFTYLATNNIVRELFSLHHS